MRRGLKQTLAILDKTSKGRSSRQSMTIIFLNLKEIPQISALGKKENTMQLSNLRHKTGASVLSTGKATHPLFYNTLTHLLSNPRCYYCVKQTHHSLSTEVHNCPHSFRPQKEEGTHRNSGTLAH